MALLILVNALAMPLLSAVIACGIVFFAMRMKLSWSRVIALFAYSAGVTYLISWLPLGTWIGEPWKWILVGIGLVRGFGFTRGQAVGVVAGSVLVIILLFYFLSSAFVLLKG